MEVLYLLIPLSAVLVLVIVGVFGWAVWRGQFDDLDDEGRRILDDGKVSVDADQGLAGSQPEQFPPSR